MNRENLDIWVEQTGGGSPVRLTDDSAEDRDPDFSPDGNQIVFRSERNRPGVYLIPALGGRARLIVPDGRNPRFSPDGASKQCCLAPRIPVRNRNAHGKSLAIDSFTTT